MSLIDLYKIKWVVNTIHIVFFTLVFDKYDPMNKWLYLRAVGLVMLILDLYLERRA